MQIPELNWPWVSAHPGQSALAHPLVVGLVIMATHLQSGGWGPSRHPEILEDCFPLSRAFGYPS